MAASGSVDRKAGRIAAAKDEAAKLKKILFTGSLKGLSKSRMPCASLEVRKVLRGHYGKVYAVDWAGHDDILLSAR